MLSVDETIARLHTLIMGKQLTASEIATIKAVYRTAVENIEESGALDLASLCDEILYNAQTEEAKAVAVAEWRARSRRFGRSVAEAVAATK